MTSTRTFLLSLLMPCACAAPALADSIPYPHPGVIAPQTIIYASSNGINAYYLGSTAGYDDQIDVYDVATGWDSGKVLDNKTTPLGSEVTLGTGAGQINAGDQLIFYIDSPDGHFASVSSKSPDGINHAYITKYSGGTVNNVSIPAGFFVGMEDLPYGSSDLNYNDDDFVFTGVATKPASVTPEPGALALFATGLLAMLGVRRYRHQS